MACIPKEPLPSGDDIASDSSGSETEATDESTDGCPPVPDLPADETSTDSTETDTTESDSTDTGMAEDWYVMTGAALPVGRLVSPGPENFALPGNMFDGAIPRIAYVVNDDGYAFSVNQHKRIFTNIAHDDLYFTGDDCTGTAMDHFALRIVDDVPFSQSICETPGDIDASVEAFYFPYGFHDEAAAWLELNWPGAPGFMATRPAAGANQRWYEIPIDQPWPSPMVAGSVLHVIDNVCEPISMFICAVVMYESDFVPGIQDGPFHLEQMP